jgi:hypothetical protein
MPAIALERFVADLVMSASDGAWTAKLINSGGTEYPAAAESLSVTESTGNYYYRMVVNKLFTATANWGSITKLRVWDAGNHDFTILLDSAADMSASGYKLTIGTIQFNFV